MREAIQPIHLLYGDISSQKQLKTRTIMQMGQGTVPCPILTNATPEEPKYQVISRLLLLELAVLRQKQSGIVKQTSKR